MRNGEDREFSEEQRMMLERDNPLHMEFGASVQLNGKNFRPFMDAGPYISRTWRSRTGAQKEKRRQSTTD